MSTYEETLRNISLDADASIAQYTGISGMPGSASPNYGHQFSWVKVTGDHTAGLCTQAANEVPLGVLQNKPQKLGTAATVAIAGVSNIIAGTGGFAAGGRVKPDANGHAVAAATGDLSYGVAIAAAVAGSVGPVFLVRS